MDTDTIRFLAFGAYAIVFPLFVPFIFCIAFRKSIRRKVLFIFAGFGVSYLAYTITPMIVMFCSAFFSALTGNFATESPESRIDSMLLTSVIAGTLGSVLSMWILMKAFSKPESNIPEMGRGNEPAS